MRLLFAGMFLGLTGMFALDRHLKREAPAGGGGTWPGGGMPE